MSTAYLNGQFLPLDQARIPALDRGYLFGDGVYEVIPAYGQHIFRLDAHLARLDQSLSSIRMPNPLPHSEWQSLITRLLNLNDDSRDQAVYLQITRGVMESRAHGLPDTLTPTVLAFTWPLKGIAPEVLKHGVSAITREDNRWQRCDIKSIALLANVLLADEALREGHNEAILHRDGKITEGASSNVFALLDDTLITPASSTAILSGITRKFTLELAAQAGLHCKESELDLATLREADEIWVTSSTREIFPVTRLDDVNVGNGLPGPAWHIVYSLFQQHKRH